MDHQPKTNQGCKIHEDNRMETHLRNHAQSTPTVITRSARTLALSNYKLDGGV